MIVSKTIELIQNAHSKAQRATLSASFKDATGGNATRYERIVLEEVSCLQRSDDSVPVSAESTAAAPAKKKAKGKSNTSSVALGTTTSVTPTYKVEKQVWVSEVYHQVDESKISDDSSDDLARGKRSALHVDSESTEANLITLENIQQALDTCLPEDLKKQVLSAVESAMISFHEYYGSIGCSLTLTDQHSFAKHCGLLYSPHLVLFLVQCLPEFRNQGALSITIEALVAFTAALERLTVEIFGHSITHDESSINLTITPRHLQLSVTGNAALKKAFPGIIRNGGVTPFAEPLKPPDNIANPAMAAKLENFLREIDEDYGGTNGCDVIVHPLTGGFCCPRATSMDLMEVSLLDVLADLSFPPPRSPAEREADPQGPPRLDNIVRRKMQAIEVLGLKHRNELNEFIKSPAALWSMRSKEVAAAQRNPMPIFSPSQMLRLSEYIDSRVVTDFYEHCLLQFSMEACEVIGCVVETFLIDQFGTICKSSRVKGLLFA